MTCRCGQALSHCSIRNSSCSGKIWERKRFEIRFLEKVGSSEAGLRMGVMPKDELVSLIAL